MKILFTVEKIKQMIGQLKKISLVTLNSIVMTSTAEKLCVLAELGPAILHRLFTIKKDLESNEKNELLKPTKQNQSLFTRITKNETLDFPDDIDKKEASVMDSWFKPKMSIILKLTTPIFCAFKEFDEWCDVAISTLEELCSNVTVDFSVI
jgi:hypothetical protein